tara:strand:- start:8784 stop:9461 length:678 start_codon:yes stop_codon:yes gene_type:complete
MTNLATDITPKTRYKKSIKKPNNKMLKEGKANKKLGWKITRRMWKGMPIHSLTLEERETCTPNCLEYKNCYGNNMPFAHRFDHTAPDFYKKLLGQIKELANKYPAGFVLRLHVLGDFFSPAYVAFWHKALLRFPQLNIFGYTHHLHSTNIGRKLNQLNGYYPTRMRIRYSGDPHVSFSARVVKKDEDPNLKNGETICPEQTGKLKHCAECAYCWTSKHGVVFLEH